jgi:predicted PhzF superfamily epimerase YddE/YHI9
MATRTFEFVQLDVFTQRPLEGNQLAVFSDARGLSDSEMQKLAPHLYRKRRASLCRASDAWYRMVPAPTGANGRDCARPQGR